MRIDDPKFRDAMLSKFDCHLLVSGGKPERPDRVKRRLQTEKAYSHFRTAYPYSGTREEALAKVKAQWTVGMGPVAAWLLWTMIGSFVKQFVFWAWEQATS